MRILIFISFFISNLWLFAQKDTIFTNKNAVIPCTITQTTSSVYFYSQNNQIKSIDVDYINFISINGVRSHYTDTVSIKDEITLLKKSLDSYAKQKQLSAGLIFGGTVIGTAGALIGANINRYAYTLVPIGSIITIVGVAGNIDSYKFLRKAGFGIKGNGVTYTIH